MTTVEERRGRCVEKTTWRFAISDRAREEIIRRLLELNHKKRSAEEVAQGLNTKSAGKSKLSAKKPALADRVMEPPCLFDATG